MEKGNQRIMFAIFYMILCSIETLCQDQSSPSDENSNFFRGLLHDERDSMEQPCDDNTTMDSYNFIIVGAGAAGCALARRLTEVEGWDVLLIEAGGDDTSSMDIPGLNGRFLSEETGWIYRSAPSANNARAFKDNRTPTPQGKVMGGGSTMNFMMATWGNRLDYDNWRDMGNPGWDYKSVKPYIKKVENVLISELGNSPHRSTVGNIPISYAPYQSPMSVKILEAAHELGYKIGDYNGKNQAKFSRLQLTARNGTRFSASRAYLNSIRFRRNLHVKKGSTVTKILIHSNNKTAYGVEYERGGSKFVARAKHEVIISGGAIKSPQLLMLSGIGPEIQLKKFNIPVIANLSVGDNFMDHPSFYGLFFSMNKSVVPSQDEVVDDFSNWEHYFANKTGPLSAVYPLENIAFLQLKDSPYYSQEWPPLETVIASSTMFPSRSTATRIGFTDKMYNNFLKTLEDKNVFQPIPINIRPRSRGTVKLRDTNINTEPIIDSGLFNEEVDVEVIIAGIKEWLNLTKSSSVLQKLGVKVYDKPIPPCKNFPFGSDKYWNCAVKQMSAGLYHPSGTCKMGPSSDKHSVVDPELKVHGVNNLRVVCSAIIPMIISGHLVLPTYMIAEKAADMIKESFKI